MSKRRNWTAWENDLMRTMREEGASWVDVASQFGIGVVTARERGRRLGLPIAFKPERGKTQTGPEGLAAAVVHLAVNDATAPTNDLTGYSADRPSPREQLAAIAFCTDTHGPWAAERLRWCDMASPAPSGVLAEAVRRIVLNKMAEARGGA